MRTRSKDEDRYPFFFYFLREADRTMVLVFDHDRQALEVYGRPGWIDNLWRTLHDSSHWPIIDRAVR